MQTLALLQNQPGAPEGVVETLQSGASIFFLWITFGGMFLATLAFTYLAASGRPGQGHHYITSAAITAWAAVWYIVMATGGGIATVQREGAIELFYYARYIDWAITTPLLLLVLSWVALGGSIRRAPGLVGALVLADVLMILTGLAGGGTGSDFRYFWFVVSSIFFIVVLALMWGPLRAEALRGQPEGGQSLFFFLATLLTILWFFYPIVWLVGTEGAGAIGPSAEVFFFAVLDILAKIAFGFFLLGGIRRAQGTSA